MLHDRHRLVTEGVVQAAAVGVLPVATAGALLFSTQLGIGVGPDGTAYLGLRPPDVGHAPLYGALMRLAAMLPFGVDVTARLYHVAVYAATAVVSWRLLYSATGRASPAWAGALLISFTGQALVLYSMALSEPTFVLLVVLEFFALSAWIDTRARRIFFAAAVVAAFATLARHAGVALVATGAFVAFAASARGLTQRCVRAAAFAAIGVLPALAWMMSVVRATGTAGGRQAAFAGTADASTFYDGLLEATRYLLPTEFPPAVRIAVLVAVLASLAAATIVFYRPAPPRGEVGLAVRGEWRAHRYLPLILVLFVVAYSAVIVLGVLVEPYLPISDRYLYPTYVALVLLGAITLPALARTTTARRTVAVAVVGFVALSTARAAKVAANGHEQGWAYAAAAWRASPAVAYVNALPAEAVVYSDNPFALLYLTRREIHRVPNVILRRLGSENPNYEREIAEMRLRLHATNGVILIFERDRGEFVMPVLPELMQAMPLAEKARFSDATVYALAEPQLRDARGGC